MAPVGSVIVAGLLRLICLSNQHFFAVMAGSGLSFYVEKLTRCGVGDAHQGGLCSGWRDLDRVGALAWNLMPCTEAYGQITRSKPWQRSVRSCWRR